MADPAETGPRAKPSPQVGALPLRRDRRGALEVLLVTSRDTGRWIIPKGWPMAGKTKARAAAREALEEAGVTGQLVKPALGHFDYEKFMPEGPPIPCRVTVFALWVDKVHESWEEAEERRRHWWRLRDAVALVEEEALREIILRLETETPP